MNTEYLKNFRLNAIAEAEEAKLKKKGKIDADTEANLKDILTEIDAFTKNGIRSAYFDRRRKNVGFGEAFKHLKEAGFVVEEKVEESQLTNNYNTVGWTVRW